MGVLHPVEVDKKDDLYCRSGGSDNADGRRIFAFGASVIRFVAQLREKGQVERGNSLQACGASTILTTFCATAMIPSPSIITVSRLILFIRCVFVNRNTSQKFEMAIVQITSKPATTYHVTNTRAPPSRKRKVIPRYMMAGIMFMVIWKMSGRRALWNETGGDTRF